MSNKITKLLALALALIMVFALAACQPPADTSTDESKDASSGDTSTPPTVQADVPADRFTADQRTGSNATKPFVVSTNTLDGKFSPFFYTSAYDGNVVDITQIGLLSIDKDGVPVADAATNLNKPCLCYSYTQNIEGEGENKTSTYKFILKNGVTFADGTPVTVKDVLFSIYVLCDPLYDGSSTFYALNVKGLPEYRLQTTAENLAKANAIMAAGVDENGKGVATDGIDAADQTAFWAHLGAAGEKFAQEIVDYCVNSYGTDAYVKSYLGNSLSMDDLRANEALKVVLGMRMWGFGSAKTGVDPNGNIGLIDEKKTSLYEESTADTEGAVEGADGKFYIKAAAGSTATAVFTSTAATEEGGKPTFAAYTGDRYLTDAGKFGFTDASGNSYDLKTTFPTITNYWENILGAYGYDFSDAGINYEKAGDTSIEMYCRDLYLANEGKAEGGVASISGITSGKETIDGVERDYVQVVIDGVDPVAIFKMSLYVCPWQYYTNGFSGELNDFGVALKNADFIATLKSKNGAPAGGGPYKFIEYKDNVVTYEANDNFLLGAPKIKYFRYNVVTSGAEMDALKTGTVHYSDPSATTQIIKDITEKAKDCEKLDYILVDNDGYGYIGIQGELIPELEVRQAIAYATNVELCLNYYGELASVNYRPMTKVQWAYPDNPVNLFPYDGTGAKSKELFLKAGYKYDETNNVMSYPDGHEKAGQQVEFVLTLPSDSKDHPAGSVFADMVLVLGKIGVKATVSVDTDLLNKLNTAKENGIMVWAAAWGSGGVDPDMFQIWCSDPTLNQGSSAERSGLYFLFDKGSEEEKKILTDLNRLIDEGRSTLDTEERKEIYKQALDLASSICVEIPTYQRKNMYVYDKEYVKGDTLLSGEDVTPYQGPLARIWEVELI